jgi:hypothetical protein
LERGNSDKDGSSDFLPSLENYGVSDFQRRRSDTGKMIEERSNRVGFRFQFEYEPDKIGLALIVVNCPTRMSAAFVLSNLKH